MTTRTMWIDRCPMQWRAAVLVLASSRAWRATAIAILAIAVGGAFFAQQNETTVDVLAFYGPPLLAITIFAGVREHLTRVAVWTGLFQRPVNEMHELMRILSLRAALYLVGAGLLLGGAVAGLLAGDAVPSGTLGYTLLTAVLWSVVVLFAMAAVGMLTTQGAAAVVIAWLISPLILAMLVPALGIPDAVRHVIEFLLPPVDAVFGYDEVLRGLSPDDAVRYTTQLLTFPLLCIAIIGWRLRAWVRADLVGGA